MVQALDIYLVTIKRHTPSELDNIESIGCSLLRSYDIESLIYFTMIIYKLHYLLLKYYNITDLC